MGHKNTVINLNCSNALVKVLRIVYHSKEAKIGQNRDTQIDIDETKILHEYQVMSSAQ